MCGYELYIVELEPQVWPATNAGPYKIMATRQDGDDGGNAFSLSDIRWLLVIAS